ncbi:MAG: hypothetical protein AAGM67_09535, partial [Bacteroidota bacterium]
MRITFIIVFFAAINFAAAKNILADLTLNKGDWALVGVPLHNYQLIPIQQELGTFITKNKRLLAQLQTDWDFERTFEDDCDYHY